MKRIKLKTKKVKPVILEQWLEIKRKDGETVVQRYPPNKELERMRQEMDPPPSLIYRRMNFVHGVPLEYRWTEPSLNTTKYGGMFLQRLSVEDWQQALRLEGGDGTGRVVPVGRTQKRPDYFGPCPCERCKRERELAAA